MGEGGTDGLFFMSNGGKTNAKGRLEYYGALPHLNPLFCPVAAKGYIFLFRFTSGFGQSEKFPDFLDPADYYMVHSCRPDQRNKGRHDLVTYETQRKNFKKVYDAIGYVGAKVTHQGRAQLQVEMTSNGMSREEKLQFCRYYNTATLQAIPHTTSMFLLEALYKELAVTRTKLDRTSAAGSYLWASGRRAL